MFQAIKDNVSTLVIAVLVAMLLLTGVSLMSVKADLASTEQSLELAKANQAVLQADLDTATDELKAAEREKERLRLDAALTASTLVVREQGRDAVDELLLDTTAKATAIIEDSNDETVNTWATTAVPDDLNRLLEHAAYCANGDNHQDSVCIAAQRINQPVQGARLYGAHQPRSL